MDLIARETERRSWDPGAIKSSVPRRNISYLDFPVNAIAKA
jgi:hypothetical protein